MHCLIKKTQPQQNQTKLQNSPVYSLPFLYTHLVNEFSLWHIKDTFPADLFIQIFPLDVFSI